MKPMYITLAFLLCTVCVAKSQGEDHEEIIHDNTRRAFLVGKVMAEGMHDNLPYYSIKTPVSDQIKRAEDIEYSKGVIVDNDLKSYQFEGAFLVHENQIAMRTESEDLHLLKKEKVSGVMLGEDKYLTVAAQEKLKRGSEYKWYFMTPLHYGKLTLYSHKIMKEKPISSHPTMGTMLSEKEVVTETIFYYAKGDEKLVKPLPKGRAKLLELFGTHADEVKAYMKKNRLQVSEDTDLIRIFRRYDDLVAHRSRL